MAQAECLVGTSVPSRNAGNSMNKPIPSLYRFLCAVTAGFAIPVASLAQSASVPLTVGNGSLEQWRDGRPVDWGPYRWGDNGAAATQETIGAHHGGSCARLKVTRYASGGLLLAKQFAIRRGHTYTVTAYLKDAGDCRSAYLRVWEVSPAAKCEGKRVMHGAYPDPTPEWKPYTLKFWATRDADNAELRFELHDVSTLYVDNVSVQEEAPADVSGPERKGNLLPNGSFEVGPWGWSPSAIERVKNPPERQHGTRALRFRHAGRTTSQFIKCRAPRVHTLSLWARSTVPGHRLKFAVLSGMLKHDGGRDGLRKTVSLTHEWKRFSVTGPLPLNLTGSYFVEASVPGIHESASIWIDAVQVEEGTATPYMSHSQPELGVAITEPWDRTLVLGQEAVAVLSYWSAEPLRRLRYEVQDIRKRTLMSGSIPPLVLRNRFDAPIELPSKQAGAFRFLARVGRTEVDVAFSVAPNPAPGRNPFFGSHCVPIAHTIATAQKLGIAGLRSHDMSTFTHWWLVEPKQRELVWDEAQWQAYHGTGFEWLGLLEKTPVWAAACPPNTPSVRGARKAFPPQDLGDWRRYVGAVVRHYLSIRQWEVWNEPYHRGFWRGTPEQYVRLLRTAYETIKAIDPGLAVVGGCVNVSNASNRQWARTIFHLGALRWMDVLSFHRYFDPLRLDEADRYAEEIAWLRDEMENAGGPLLPLLNSEWGVNSGASPTLAIDGVSGRHAVCPAPDPHLAAAQLTKVCAVGLGEGIERSYCYFMAPRGHFHEVYNIMNLLEVGGHPKPMAIAFAAASKMLATASGPQRLSLHDPWLGYVFRTGEQQTAVLWSADGRPLPLAACGPGLPFQTFDMFGNSIAGRGEFFDGEPMYVRGRNLEAILRSLLAR